VLEHSDTQIIAVAGEGTSIDGATQILLSSGAQITAFDTFAYIERGIITSLTPNAGHWGTVVELAGTNLLGGGDMLESVTFAGIEATIVYSENDEMTSGSGSDSGSERGSGEVVNILNTRISLVAAIPTNLAEHTGAVVVLATSGAVTTLTNGWTYEATPIINQVTPSVGLSNTRVDISGTNLFGGGAAIVSVTLAGSDATLADGQSEFRIPVIAGASDATSAGDVRLVADTGATVVKGAAFTYLEPAIITSVSPSAGSAGTLVTIQGQSLQLDGVLASVSLAGIVALIVEQTPTNVEVSASNCVNGACPSLGSIVLTGSTGATLTKELSFKYARIEAIVPNFGQLGTVVTISGQGLQLDGAALTSLTLAGINVERITSESDTEIVAVAGASGGSTGALSIDIQSGTSSASKSLMWSYLEPSKIDAVLPASGQEGTIVTVHGQRLFGGGTEVHSVFLGSLEALIVTATDTTIVAIVNHDASPVNNQEDIIVTSNTGARTVLPGGWLQLQRGDILDTSLDEGQLDSVLRISGDRLLGGGDSIVSVTIVGIAAEIVNQTNSDVYVIVAHGTAGQGDIVMIANTGARIVEINGFVLLELGEITAVEPSSGQLGTVVTIDGARLFGGGDNLRRVTLAGERAPIVGQSNTLVTVTAPTATAKTGNVVLTANTGATVTLTNGWTFLETGVINNVTPTRGVRGTRVVISGARLGGGGSVDTVMMAGFDALIASASDNEIHVILKPGSAGLGDVVLTADTGAVVTAANAFSYLEYGAADEPSPAAGQTGTRVTLCGTGILGGGAQFETALLGTCETNIVGQDGDCVTLEI
jgi:hypothetical protein